MMAPDSATVDAVVGQHRRLAERMDAGELGRRQHRLGVALVFLQLVGNLELLEQPEDALRARVVEVVDGDHRGVSPATAKRHCGGAGHAGCQSLDPPLPETRMTNEDVIDTLNTLIETCKDGEYGFRTCAEHVKSTQLRQVFTSRADECRAGRDRVAGARHPPRRQGRHEQQRQRHAAPRLGQPQGGARPATATRRRSTSASAARTPPWRAIAMRSRKRCRATSPAVVQRQYEGVKQNHDQIRTLRDQVRSTT